MELSSKPEGVRPIGTNPEPYGKSSKINTLRYKTVRKQFREARFARQIRKHDAHLVVIGAGHLDAIHREFPNYQRKEIPA